MLDQILTGLASLTDPIMLGAIVVGVVGGVVIGVLPGLTSRSSDITIRNTDNTRGNQEDSGS